MPLSCARTHARVSVSVHETACQRLIKSTSINGVIFFPPYFPFSICFIRFLLFFLAFFHSSSFFHFLFSAFFDLSLFLCSLFFIFWLSNFSLNFLFSCVSISPYICIVYPVLMHLCFFFLFSKILVFNSIMFYFLISGSMSLSSLNFYY